MEIKLFTTEDGSHSLYNPHLKETYHSSHGAITESNHVFIKEGLEYFTGHHSPGEIKIFEVGFGTGLNALLSRIWAERNKLKVTYHSIEQFPVAPEIISELNYGQRLDEEDKYHQLHNISWNKSHELSPFFTIKKINAEWVAYSFESNYQIIYYDAFAPGKQPEMWDVNLLQKSSNALQPNGILTTYCARGQFKRDLATVGFKVETLSGPPGKKEMVRAIRQD